MLVLLRPWLSPVLSLFGGGGCMAGGSIKSSTQANIHNIRVQQNFVSGPLNQNLGSFHLFTLWGPY